MAIRIMPTTRGSYPAGANVWAVLQVPHNMAAVRRQKIPNVSLLIKCLLSHSRGLFAALTLLIHQMSVQ